MTYSNPTPRLPLTARHTAAGARPLSHRILSGLEAPARAPARSWRVMAHRCAPPAGLALGLVLVVFLVLRVGAALRWQGAASPLTPANLATPTAPAIFAPGAQAEAVPPVAAGAAIVNESDAPETAPVQPAQAQAARPAAPPARHGVIAHSARSHPSAPPARAPLRVAAAPAAPAEPAPDRDAALLGALIAHSATVQREVVERRPGDSSAALLERCRQFGALEARLCQWRICAGRWDSDAACKVL